jgi:hypothetical protein
MSRPISHAFAFAVAYDKSLRNVEGALKERESARQVSSWVGASGLLLLRCWS